MKKLITIILLLFLSFSYGQKRELRNANKFYDSGEFSSALDLLESSKVLFDSSDDKVKSQQMLLYGKIHTSMQDFSLAMEAFNISKDLGISSDQLGPELMRLENLIITNAIADQESGNSLDAAIKLKMAYDLNPEVNQDYLYFAAGNAVNSINYSLALEYYLLLRDINYDGVTTKFYITEVESGNEIEISSEDEFNLLQKSKDYDNPREELTESRLPEIVKNIALIYKELGDNDKALQAIETARSSNPDDVSLITTAANIYYELGDKESFKNSMALAIEKEPNNALLFYNLGVISTELGEKDSAFNYYKKSIELDPLYESSYLNLVALILEGEQDIVDEMNTLGTSRSDNLRYDELKKTREDLYKSCVPILKDLIALNNNTDAIRTLMNIYGILGDNSGFTEMKDLLEQQQ